MAARVAARRVRQPTSSLSSNMGLNWQKIWSSCFRATLASTFNRPLEGRERGGEGRARGGGGEEEGGEEEREERTGQQKEGSLLSQTEQPVFSPVRHANDEAFNAIATGLVDDVLHGRNEHLTALQTKPLLTRPLLTQECFKPLWVCVCVCVCVHTCVGGVGGGAYVVCERGKERAKPQTRSDSQARKWYRVERTSRAKSRLFSMSVIWNTPGASIRSRTQSPDRKREGLQPPLTKLAIG